MHFFFPGFKKIDYTRQFLVWREGADGPGGWGTIRLTCCHDSGAVEEVGGMTGGAGAWQQRGAEAGVRKGVRAGARLGQKQKHQLGEE